jgi:hypothetical protein
MYIIGVQTFDEAMTHLGWRGGGMATCCGAAGFPIKGVCDNGDNSSGCVASNNAGAAAVHGVMIGRAAYNHPLMFAHADALFYDRGASVFRAAASSRDAQGKSSPCRTIESAFEYLLRTDEDFRCSVARQPSRRSVVESYLEYAADAQAADLYGSLTCNIVKPLHNFFSDAPAYTNQLYKRRLDELLKENAGSSGNKRALQQRQPQNQLRGGSGGGGVCVPEYGDDPLLVGGGGSSEYVAKHQLSLQDIVWSAIDETIPARWLDQPLGAVEKAMVITPES